MNSSSGRPIPPGEYPEWDAALALVNHDLDALLPGRGPLRLWGIPSWDEEESEWVYVVMPDGTWQGNQLEAGGGVLGVADAAQETVMERLWEVWPVCDTHRLGMHGRDEEGRDVWWCAGEGGHVQGAVGELAPGYRPRQERRKERKRRKSWQPLAHNFPAVRPLPLCVTPVASNLSIAQVSLRFPSLSFSLSFRPETPPP